MDKPLIDGLAERLERLERENRRLRRISAVVLFGAIALIAGGADQDHVVEAQRFLLKNKLGQVRAALASSPDGSPDLSFFDRAGKVRVRMAIEEDQVDGKLREMPSVSLCDSSGKARIMTDINPYGVPMISFFDNQGLPRFDMFINDPADFVSLEFADKNFKPIFSLSGGGNGVVGMHFEHGGAKSRIGLSIQADGTPTITLNDKEERERFVVEGKPDGSASLKLLDKSGRPLFQTPKP